MMVFTYIYQDFENDISSTHQLRASVARLGLELVNVADSPHHHGNGHVLRLLYQAYKEASGPIVYADGADSYFLRAPVVPTDHILYSTEKAIWPPVPELIEAWNEQPKETPWCYLNGGGYCGPAELIVAFFERYGLNSQPSEANGQWQQAQAYMQSIKDGFPIKLDQRCTEFQTIGFADPGDFSSENGILTNNRTGTQPAVIHGNGRTPMGWVYGIDK